jgi:hypothetical protein
MKLPRICWELCIVFIAQHVMSHHHHQQQQQRRRRQADPNTPQTITHMLLSWMLLSTGFIDIFVWSPYFAFRTNFESCTGGFFSGRPRICVDDYTKGFIRLLTSIQCMLGGFLYLFTALLLWNIHTTISTTQNIDRTMMVWSNIMNNNSNKQRQKQQQQYLRGSTSRIDLSDISY